MLNVAPSSATSLPSLFNFALVTENVMVFVSGRFDIEPVPRRVVVAAVAAFESVELMVFCGGVEVPAAAALRFLLVVAGAVTAAGVESLDDEAALLPLIILLKVSCVFGFAVAEVDEGSAGVAVVVAVAVRLESAFWGAEYSKSIASWSSA